MNIRTLLPTMALALGLCAPARAGPPVLTVYTYDSFASEWGPGPLVSYLVTKMGHRLPVPVTVVPGGMTLERIDAVC